MPLLEINCFVRYRAIEDFFDEDVRQPKFFRRRAFCALPHTQGFSFRASLGNDFFIFARQCAT